MGLRIAPMRAVARETCPPRSPAQGPTGTHAAAKRRRRRGSRPMREPLPTQRAPAWPQERGGPHERRHIVANGPAGRAARGQPQPGGGPAGTRAASQSKGRRRPRRRPCRGRGQTTWGRGSCRACPPCRVRGPSGSMDRSKHRPNIECSRLVPMSDTPFFWLWLKRWIRFRVMHANRAELNQISARPPKPAPTPSPWQPALPCPSCANEGAHLSLPASIKTLLLCCLICCNACNRSAIVRLTPVDQGVECDLANACHHRWLEARACSRGP